MFSGSAAAPEAKVSAIVSTLALTAADRVRQEGICLFRSSFEIGTTTTRGTSLVPLRQCDFGHVMTRCDLTRAFPVAPTLIALQARKGDEAGAEEAGSASRVARSSPKAGKRLAAGAKGQPHAGVQDEALS